MEERVRPVPIIESMGARFNCSTMMAGVALAWAAPAAMLTMVGGTAIAGGVGLTGEVAMAHEWARAVIVLLALVTFPVGGIWAIRRWPLPAVGDATSPRSARSGPSLMHGSLLLGSALFAALTPLTEADDRLWSLAALAGLGAIMIVPRSISRLWSPLSPVTALAALIGYELTVGWLQLLGTSMLGSMLLLAEGLAMVWCAVSAARAVMAPPWLPASDADRVVDSHRSEQPTLPSGASAGLS